MKKILKSLAVVSMCVFTFAAIGFLCSKTKFELPTEVDTKILIPAPVRKGDKEEGVFIG